jgi:hypothetical protein
MAGASKSADAEKTRIMLGLLESVERGGAQSQRRLASELGVALGLVNAYLKRCITKGLVKVGAERVLVPALLGVREQRGEDAANGRSEPERRLRPHWPASRWRCGARNG